MKSTKTNALYAKRPWKLAKTATLYETTRFKLAKTMCQPHLNKTSNSTQAPYKQLFNTALSWRVKDIT